MTTMGRRVFGGSAEHLRQEGRDVLGVVATHLSEQGREERIQRHPLIEACRQAVEHFDATHPFIKARHRGIRHDVSTLALGLSDRRRGGRGRPFSRAQSPTSLSSSGRTVTLQQEPEHQPVRDQEQRYQDGRNVVGGAQLTRLDPDAEKALIEGVEQIRGTPKVEDPDQADSEPAPQPRQREQGQDCGNEITICGWARESARQVRPDNAGHQEGQADESETVEQEQRLQGADPRLVAQGWPKVSRREDPPGNEAERDTDSEEGLRRHHGLLAPPSRRTNASYLTWNTRQLQPTAAILFWEWHRFRIRWRDAGYRCASVQAAIV